MMPMPSLPMAAFWPDDAVMWAGVICTLAIFSLLYKENPVYRFFEHLFIGVATGYTVSQAWQDILKPKWWDLLVAGDWWMIFALLLGLLYYTIYIPRWSWMSRLLIGAMMGFGAGVAFQGFATQYGPQVGAAFVPLVPKPGMSAYALINNWIVMLTLIAVMTYFFFAFEQQNKAVRTTAKFGRWLLMISFGAIFGQTVMARMALATNRLEFLIDSFRHVFGIR
jgi:hypothetical protein